MNQLQTLVDGSEDKLTFSSDDFFKPLLRFPLRFGGKLDYCDGTSSLIPDVLLHAEKLRDRCSTSPR